MSKKDKLLLKLLMEKYEITEDGFESGRGGSSAGSYGLNPEDGDNVEIYRKGEYKYKSSYELPEEVWTNHGEFTFSSKVDTMLGVIVSCLVCLKGVDRVSYRTSNHGGINFKIKGGDPAIIAEIIYRYRTAGTKSMGNLTYMFETKSGETRQESFDYVY